MSWLLIYAESAFIKGYSFVIMPLFKRATFLVESIEKLTKKTVCEQAADIMTIHCIAEMSTEVSMLTT